MAHRAEEMALGAALDRLGSESLTPHHPRSIVLHSGRTNRPRLPQQPQPAAAMQPVRKQARPLLAAAAQRAPTHSAPCSPRTPPTDSTQPTCSSRLRRARTTAALSSAGVFPEGLGLVPVGAEPGVVPYASAGGRADGRDQRRAGTQGLDARGLNNKISGGGYQLHEATHKRRGARSQDPSSYAALTVHCVTAPTVGCSSAGLHPTSSTSLSPQRQQAAPTHPRPPAAPPRRRASPPSAAAPSACRAPWPSPPAPAGCRTPAAARLHTRHPGRQGQLANQLHSCGHLHPFCHICLPQNCT